MGIGQKRQRGREQGAEGKVILLLSLAPAPRLLLLPASQYHQMTLPTQHVVLVNVFINISKNE
ncbi:hypothetical protein A6V25_13965 [Nostoc sp. ATCC 53789]|nr:hypothetical protein A6V25_13965 [Nostoc sp. ATCC 53789]